MSNKLLIFDAYQQTMEQLKPNTLFTVKTEVGQVCLVKTDQGLRFFKDACPHLGVPLTQSGVCNNLGEVVCKEHGHRYSMRNGQECEGRRERLLFIPFEIENDRLFLLVVD
ncbi:MAG TPA: Rieske 2Fe-2S domain-containing protein [Cytophagales bacterium]|nr:Rieske 2Fe-2S domain-containing protein [Cytophagales bacterium]